MSAFDETIPGQKRKTLAQIIAERAGGQGQPFDIPQLSTVSPSPVQSSPDFTGPSQISPLQRKETQLAKMDAPPTRKQSLLQAVAQAAPIAIGGLFGGSVGASGAAQGVDETRHESQARQDLKRKTLAQEVEAEKNRQERMGEHELTAQTAAGTLAEQVRAHDLEAQGKRDTVAGENERARLNREAEDKRAADSLAETVRYHDEELKKPTSVSPGVGLVKPGESAPFYTQPALPPQPQAPMSPERFQQEQTLKTPPQDQTAVQEVDDPANPGKKMLVVVNKNKFTSTPVSGPASKSPNAVTTANAKTQADYDHANQSLTALKNLAKNQTSASDQAMVTQFFDIIKPGSGARMNEAEIARLINVGSLPERAQVWFQKANSRQAFTPEIRNEILQAAQSVVDAKKPPKGGGGALTKEQAASYLQKAGGDKEKARTLARLDGFKF